MEVIPERYIFPEEEEKVLQYWDRIDAFHKSLKESQNRPTYTFYDGPPFATGLPHYGHILAGTIKDIVTRYKHMSGYHVERRFGWDCHGLPIEFEINKDLGIKTKQQVEEYGIYKYNEACRGIVMRYSSEWENVVKRLGRWIDFQNSYKTMDSSFMESIWWVFAQLWKKDLVYRGFKVMPYSLACTTPLSNFEAGLSYKEVDDPSVFVRFNIKTMPNVGFVAWTTTPWTLPSNLALCVNPNMTYIHVKDVATSVESILLESRTESLFKDQTEYAVIGKMLGQELVGLPYEPLFDYFISEFPNAFVVVADDYVSDASGTGIVHQAPAFGEEDFRVCIREGICTISHIPSPIDDDGFFTSQIPEIAGIYLKDADKHIIEMLKKKKLIVKRQTIRHSYPFCWRSDTPLIYRAVPSWFVKVTSFRDNLVANNALTCWVPEFVKDKRFHNWLKEAKDWTISRNRFWGTPLPIWHSDDFQEIVIIESIEQLYQESGILLTDLHRHHLDDITIPSKQGKGVLHRVPEVFDCWFESGSMPYAQRHYPFEDKDNFSNHFPADFVAEGIDQTRGWFYTLMVLSTALFDKPAFKNLIVSGLVLASDGKKMSKRLKNYPPAMDIVGKHGADALRLYLINSPVVRADQLRFKEEGVAAIVKDLFLRWFNSYRFLIQNILRCNGDGQTFVYNKDIGQKTTNVMDEWLLSSTQTLIKFYHQEMDAYRLYTIIPRLVKFIERLANVYVRLNRFRLKGNEGVDECHCALSTLTNVLLALCSIMAPFTPFLVESLYQKLVHLLPESERRESIHFTSIVQVDESLFNPEVEAMMEKMLEVIDLARMAREQSMCPLRQPLRKLIVFHSDPSYLNSLKHLERYICSEVSVRELELRNDLTSAIRMNINLILQRVGSRLRGDRNKVQAQLHAFTNEQVLQFQSTGQVDVMGYTITLEDTNIVRQFINSDDSATYYPSGNENVITVLDLTIDEIAVNGRILREFMNRIQRLRKHAKLIHSDNVIVFYTFLCDDAQVGIFNKVVDSNRQVIESTTHSMLVPEVFRRPHDVIIDQNTDGLVDVKLQLVICRPRLYVDIDQVVASGLTNLTVAYNLDVFASSLGEASVQQLIADGKLQLNLDGQSTNLTHLKDIYENVHRRIQLVSLSSQ